MKQLKIILLALAFIALQAHAKDDRNLAINQVNHAVSEQRIALVIGNNAYKSAPLANPINDARDIAKALSGFGFSVTLRENANQRDMKQAIREFTALIKHGGTGLLYFAGHGVQSKGRNYLIPVDADIQQEYELEDQAVDANIVLAAMDEAQNPVNIVILDACRNNPFARSFRSATSGLAQMDSVKGTLIAYATAPGSVAADGAERNGIYTKHLLQSLQQPDSDIARVFSRVRAAVVRETGGRQIPWESTSLIGDFYFNAVQMSDTAHAPLRTEPQQISALALEISYWESVQQSKNGADFESYLSKYPNGQYAQLAHNRIEALLRQPVSSLSTADAVMSGPPATVIFYRPRAFTGWGNATSITAKGRELGQLENGDYFTAKLAAGSLVVVGETGDWSGQRIFDIEPGQTYYIEIAHDLGKVNLRMRPKSEALEAIGLIKPSKQSSVTNGN